MGYSDSDFFDAQLAPKTISVPYSNAALTVYQHKLDMHRYYVAPVGIFQVDSMKIQKHPLTKIYGLQFTVLLTSSHIRNTVLQYLALKLSNCVSTATACTVELVPTDRIRLHWSTSSVIDSRYSIDKAWHTNTNLQDDVDFIIECTEENACQKLHNDIKLAPETFVKGLQLEYMVTGTEMPSRTIQLNSSYIRSNARYTRYKQLAEQQLSFNNDRIYISTEDKNQLLTAIARDSLAQQTEDEEYQADAVDSQTDLVKLLGDMLISEHVTLKSHMDEAWKSLYWNENNQRPDETVKILEKIWATLQSENHTKHCNETGSFTDKGSELNLSVKLPEQLLELLAAIKHIPGRRSLPSGSHTTDHRYRYFETNNDKGHPKLRQERKKRFLFDQGYASHERKGGSTSYCPDDLLKIMKQNERYVEWSGTSFQVKPMTVHRLNLGNYSDVAGMTIKKVKIKLRKNIHSVALRSSTKIISKTSDNLIPTDFGTLWIATNLTELQRRFETWEIKWQSELEAKYNKLSEKYVIQNKLMLDGLNETSARLWNFSNEISDSALKLATVRSTGEDLLDRYMKLIHKLLCWRNGEFKPSYIRKNCDSL